MELRGDETGRRRKAGGGGGMHAFRSFWWYADYVISIARDSFGVIYTFTWFACTPKSSQLTGKARYFLGHIVIIIIRGVAMMAKQTPADTPSAVILLLSYRHVVFFLERKIYTYVINNILRGVRNNNNNTYRSARGIRPKYTPSK